MSTLNQLALVTHKAQAPAELIEKLRDEGFSCERIAADDQLETRLGQAAPACVLLRCPLEPDTLRPLIQRIKRCQSQLPLLIVTDLDNDAHDHKPTLSNIEGVCPMQLPGPQLKILLQGAIRSAFHIRELRKSNEALNERSISDALTGLFNRGYMIDRLNLEFKRASRNRETLACLMIDLDHFKQINDTYGHKFGDVVLQEFGRRLSELIRETDIFGRYGGEEFVIILPNTDLNGARKLAEKLRQGLEAEPINYDLFSIMVTASFGVASTENREVITADHLLQLSDRALYKAKEAGRNRVCVAGEDSPADNEGPENTAAASRGPGRQVFVLSRQPDDNLYLRILRESNEFALQTFSGPERLAESLRSAPPQLLIIDNWDESFDIPLLCKRIKAQLKDFFVPLLVLEPELGEEWDAEARILDAGADEVLQPGLSTRDFLAHLRSMMRLKELHERWRGTYQDLTLARTRLIKVERLTALGEMASGVAHDFNNILSAIIGRAQIMRQRFEEPELLRNLEVIEQAATDGATTIRRIQEFARSTTEHAYSVIDLEQLVQDCIQITRTRWKDKAEVDGLRYRIGVEMEPELTVEGSATELREVLTNLIINGLDAMPQGGELHFRGRLEGDRVVLTVQDTGCGMNEDILKRIFDPFFSTKKGEGTGLGLSVAYGIVLRHNGRIDCTSSPGQGSCFRIELPFRPAETRAKADLPPAEEQGAPAPPIDILVVDDEAPIREIFRDVLSSAGHRVHVAESGILALEMLRDQPVQLVFTDLSMPEMSGWEVARNIRRDHPDTPIVLTSGWGKDFNQEELTRHGVDFVLPKPVSFEQLLGLAGRAALGQTLEMKL